MAAAYRRFRDVQGGGDLSGLAAVEAEAAEVLRRRGDWPDARLLLAEVRFAQHRLADARRELAAAPGLAGTPRGRALLAGIDLEDGRGAEARRALEELAGEGAGWDDLARLAHYHAVMGDADAADRWYDAAADELTAKEMREYAWVEVQRGLLDLRRGRYEETADHYERAGRAAPGWWVVQDHAAELLGARREFDRALASYEELAGRVPRPELQQAVGDLWAFMDRPERAGPWHERALAAYRASAARGEVHYLHHLADLLADVDPGAEAVAWARRDLELRRGFGAHAGLAWALHRAGRSGEAARAMDDALASGARSAQLLATAAVILSAAGRLGEGLLLRERALAYDPRLDDFRAHR